MAYALGPIGPDERHERIFVRRRSRRVLVLAVGVLAMLGSSGAFLALYHKMTRPPAAGDLPLIRADNTPTRHRPANPGGIEVPGQGTMVLDGGQGEPKVEQLLPPPETPLPRPEPAQTAAALTEAPASAPAAATPTAPAVPAPTVAAALAPATAPRPVPAAPMAAAPAPAPRIAAVAPPPPPPPPTPARIETPKPAALPAGRGYRLQIAAVRSPAAAKQEWERLRRLHSDVLGNLGFAMERVDLGARGVFYRIQAGPVADAAQAEHDCNELKQRGVGCLLVKP
jgi:cell division septation protein DedD